MGKRSLAAAVAALALGAALAIGPIAESGPPPRGAAPSALLVARGDPFATASEIRLVEQGGSRIAWSQSIRHARGAVVRGDVLADGRVAIAADEAGAPDRDWGAALWLVDANAARVLARGLYHASRPLASKGGRIYVERGASGPWPTIDEARAGRLRTDALAIDAIDPDTGTARTVFTASGYTLHLAGELESELVVYAVTYEGAQILAIDRASGRSRVVAPVLAFARDFSVDSARGALVMSNRDETDSRLWLVVRLDLRTGRAERLFAQRDEAPIPELLPSGEVRWSRGPGDAALFATSLGGGAR